MCQELLRLYSQQSSPEIQKWEQQVWLHHVSQTSSPDSPGQTLPNNTVDNEQTDSLI